MNVLTNHLLENSQFFLHEKRYIIEIMPFEKDRQYTDQNEIFALRVAEGRGYILRNDLLQQFQWSHNTYHSKVVVMSSFRFHRR